MGHRKGYFMQITFKNKEEKALFMQVLKTSIRYCEWMEKNNKNDILEIEKIIVPTKEFAINTLMKIQYGGIRN